MITTVEELSVERRKLISWANHYDHKIREARQKIFNALWELAWLSDEAVTELYSNVSEDLINLADFDFALNYLGHISRGAEDDFTRRIERNIERPDWLGCRVDTALTEMAAKHPNWFEDQPNKTVWDETKLLFKVGDAVRSNAYIVVELFLGEKENTYVIPPGTEGKVVAVDLNDEDTPYQVIFNTIKLDTPVNVEKLWVATSDID